MSWDVVLFSSKEQISSIADLDEDKLVAVNFDNTLLDYFKNSRKDGNHIIITGEDFEIDFSMDEELVSNKMISLYGENALFNIILIAKKENWQVYDSGLDNMINLDDPFVNGYKNFISYREKVIGLLK
jgi:hypothetical protein